MKIDLSKFKKISASKTHTVMMHPDGHEIRIAHDGLDPETKKQLKSLPVQKLAKGGEVDGNDDNSTPAPDSSNAGDDASALANQAPVYYPFSGFGKAAKEGIPALVKDIVAPFQSQSTPTPASDDTQATPAQASTTPPISTPPTAPQNPDPYGLGAQLDMMQKGYRQQLGGIYGQAAAEGELGKRQAGLYQQQADQQATMQQAFQQHYSQLENERKGLLQDIANQHVDPNHYINSMTTGKKVMTGLGLLFSGMGSGLSHQPNLAAKYLDDQINRDIDAQKANMGNKKTLLEANLQAFHNLHDATEMTRVMSRDIIGSKLLMEASKMQDPISKARAMKAAGELMQANAPIMQQVAMRKALLAGAASGNADPSQLVRAIVPEKEQDKALQALGQIQQIESFRKDLHEANSQLDGMVGRGALSPNKRDAIVNLLAGKLSHVTAGRYNEAEAKNQVASLLHGKGDFSQSTRDLKSHNIDVLADTLRSEHDPKLTAYGIHVPKAGVFTTQDQKALQWAQSHPQDPRAQQIMQRLRR